MKNIIIVGGGGHAKVVISVIKKLQNYNIIGYTDIKDNGKLLGVPFIGVDEIVFSHSKNTLLALGIGQIDNIEFRKKIVIKFIEKGYKFETLISPDSTINENVEVGVGSVIFDGTIVQSDSLIGEYCILNTKTSLDHDCEIGDFVHIAPGVTVCGDVKIGDDTFIGAGSTIIHGICINKCNFIKAHNLVKANII